MAAEEKSVQVMPVSFLNTADKIMENYENSSYNKMVKSPFEILVAAVLAGMFIAFGVSSSNVAAFGIKDVGLARTLTGCVFPVGLMLIVLVGGELFTGDCLMFAGFLDKRYKAIQMVRILLFVYLGNLIGSAIVAAFVFFSDSGTTATRRWRPTRSRSPMERCIFLLAALLYPVFCVISLSVLRYLRRGLQRM